MTMSDLRGRFATIDELPAPYLWDEVERRALAQPATERVRRSSASPDAGWQVPAGVGAARAGNLGLVGLLALLAVAIASTALIVGILGQRVAPTDLGPGVFLPTGSLLDQRAAHSATLLGDGRVLILGGVEGHGPFTVSGHKAPEVFGPATGTFSSIAGQVSSVAGQVGTALMSKPLPDGRVLVGGSDADGAMLLAWDPATERTEVVSKQRFRDTIPAAVALPDGRVLLLGAVPVPYLGEGSLGQVWDPSDDSLADVGLFKPAWAGPLTVAPLQDGTVLLLGGFGDTSTDPSGSGRPTEWEAILDPVAGTVRRVGPMVTPRLLETVTTLGDGRVLIAGGAGPDGRPTNAEVWDPATDSFRAIGPMIVARVRHTATLLRDGRVLLAGGDVIDGDETHATATTEMFDPMSDTSSAAAPLLQARGSHTATLLQDGRVLVAGGEQDVRSALASAELFDPSGAPAP